MHFRWRRIWLLLLPLVALLPQCVSIRMSDRKVTDYFANKRVKPVFETIKQGEHSLHVARIGADTLPMVLFIHGSPGSWDAFIDFFADSTLYSRAQLVAVDRPGFGKSELGKAEPSLQVQAARIAPVLQRAKARLKPILVGHSLGGPVAARLAMDYPNLVGGLILVAPSIDPALEKQEWYRPVGNAFPIRYWLPTELAVSNREILTLKGELEQMRPLWPGIRVPVIIIQGEDDPLVPPGNAAFAKQMLTNAPVTVQMIPKMNHFIPWRRPDLIHDAILTWLSPSQ
ncbi:alpha/beta fold hydrolase [Fibrella aquatilis]|uniref:Alpha/beta hydrolase n=1 Tax=Fibrella aquatilis TaxID=2817059 RepID=A0A939G5N3_9BACT|nr:alpha/beta hydrolase [Fibrella aquatilis]MBO0932341.1 alpha/beta hydrolase [Fibrella aquatilis]